MNHKQGDVKTYGYKQTFASMLSLFASGGTLICCALPALLVTFGMGAVMAGLASSYPQLVWLSQHKAEVFGFAAVMISIAGIMQYRARNMPCPADANKAKACKRLRRISLAIYSFSVLCFVTGFFFAFIAPLIMEK
jgi:hypothetical protein